MAVAVHKHINFKETTLEISHRSALQQSHQKETSRVVCTTAAENAKTAVSYHMKLILVYQIKACIFRTNHLSVFLEMTTRMKNALKQKSLSQMAICLVFSCKANSLLASYATVSDCFVKFSCRLTRLLIKFAFHLKIQKKKSKYFVNNIFKSINKG